MATWLGVIVFLAIWRAGYEIGRVANSLSTLAEYERKREERRIEEAKAVEAAVERACRRG